MRVLFIRVFGWSVFVSSLKLIVGVPNVREGYRMVIRSEADYRVVIPSEAGYRMMIRSEASYKMVIRSEADYRMVIRSEAGYRMAICSARQIIEWRYVVRQVIE